MVTAAVIISFLILFAVLAPKPKDDDEPDFSALPQPIPPGFQIFAKDLPLAGAQYLPSHKLDFANSSQQTLRLEREPDNPKDPNAIRIIGDCADDDYLLGYLPRDIAAQIARSGLFHAIQPRLVKIFIGQRGDGFVGIQYQLIGPKASKRQFDAAASKTLPL